uniref:Uncharacterized protein n=1 Tax=Physcomitrium patens TaxID=3218 RepID=A0A2K1IM49_PHYPA|nr:hypothetical protein PHYPA_026665 [Physcomitrium patens]
MSVYSSVLLIQAFIHSYCNYFAFSIRDLEGYKDKPIYIQL